MAEDLKQVYEFGPFVLDTEEKVLLRQGSPVPLTPRAYQVLLMLVERSGHVVEKERFMREVWDGSLRDESNLPQQVSVLRRLLGAGNGDKYIETIATRGYKFVATVRVMRPADVPETPASDDSIIVQKRTAIRVTEQSDATTLQTRGEVATLATDKLVEVKPHRARTRLFVMTTLCVALVAVAVTAYLWTRRARPPIPGVSQVPSTVKTIAVLPFKVRGQQAGDEYLEMGLADAVASKLGGVSSLVVSSMSAVERVYREGHAPDSLAAGRELRADAVLESSVQRAGEDLRVTSRLLRVSDGSQIWSGSYDEKLAQVFLLQDSISGELVAALSVKLVGDESERLARRATQNPDAYKFYLLGRYFWRIDQEKSRDYYRQAIAADPAYALAYAGLADTHIFLPAESGEVERHARRALELDDRLAEAHASLGFVQMFHRWNWDEAGKRLRRAVELNSSYPTARQWYAIYLACQGRHSESVAQMEEAVKLDPLSPELQADLGQMYFFAGDDARAVAACERALELNSRHSWARLYLFYIHAKAGRQEEAASAYLQFLTAVRPGSQYDDVLMGHRSGGLRGLLERDIDYFARVSKNPESFNRIAENYAILGDRERALYWLERSVEARNFFMPFIKVNPLFSELRGDPRYETLVRRVGLME
jgi:DNA-binding winged helix-turn-helix (wHTH) protein/TolB-like protein/Tfp pilus assembly protein PilF